MSTSLRRADPMIVMGVLVTVALHMTVVLALWLMHHSSHGAPPLGPGTFVDAQLVRFGKPRDLSFLPHKQGAVKRVGPPLGLKIARDAAAKPVIHKDEKPPDKVDPLKRTHAEVFKQLADDSQAVEEENTGSLSGSRAGTASEAKGDPYILSLIDCIGSAWTLPTTIRDDQASSLSADVCLTIDGDGRLTHFEFTRRSGNSQFDGSLEATLGSIHLLPQPPQRFAEPAARGRLCPTFYKP